MRSTSNRLTFMEAALPRKSVLYNAALVVGFSLLTALFSQFSIWIGPVPITGQTFAVLLSGALLGSRLGALSQLTYLAVGAAGAPFWFALGGTTGIARLTGPTGGYLIGFVIAAFVVGWLAERGWDRRIWTAGTAMVVGNVIIYVFGLLWLSRFLAGDAVLKAGLYPFIIGDIIKIILAALALPAGWHLLRHFKHTIS